MPPRRWREYARRSTPTHSECHGWKIIGLATCNCFLQIHSYTTGDLIASRGQALVGNHVAFNSIWPIHFGQTYVLRRAWKIVHFICIKMGSDIILRKWPKSIKTVSTQQSSRQRDQERARETGTARRSIRSSLSYSLRDANASRNSLGNNPGSNASVIAFF